MPISPKLAALRPLALALVLGLAAILGFAPFYLYFIPILSLAGLFSLWLATPSSRQALLLGFFFGLGFFGGGVSWVYISLHDFGEMSMPLALLATCLFCLLIAAIQSLAGWLQGVLHVGRDYARILLMATSWVLLEWVRGWILTGFPWLAMGYAYAPHSALAGFAPIMGVYGVSWLAALSAGLLALFIRDKRGSRLVWLALIWVAGVGLKSMAWTSPTDAPLAVSLVQGNIAQDRKWRPETLAGTLQVYGDAVLKSKSKLIILPETAFPLFREELPRPYFDRLKTHVAERRADVISGIPDALTRGDAVAYYNSAFNFGSAPTQLYRKHHLVPFGEYLPLRPLFGWVLNYLHIPLSDFSRGPKYQPPMSVAGQKVAVNICYEDVFGEEIIRQLPEATLLVNLSNDAWFGKSIGPQQHLQIAQMRALETGRYMLRATNTGVTAIINEKGVVLARAREFTTMSLDGYAQGYTGATPYVRWGNKFVLAILFSIVIISIYRGRRKD